MPTGIAHEQWILVLKCDNLGKLHTYPLQAKNLNKIMQVFENFKSLILNRYKLSIVKIMQDNDVATLP